MPYNITLLPENRTVPAEAGENLLRLLQRAGCPISAPCGGNGTCGKCKVLVNGAEVSACKTRINGDMSVSLPRSSAVQVLNDASAVSGGDGKHAYALAFDVGTTTLACCLLDGHTGAVLAKAGMANPQAAYGADVISRIQYAKTSGSRELQESVLLPLPDLRRTRHGRQVLIPGRSPWPLWPETPLCTICCWVLTLPLWFGRPICLLYSKQWKSLPKGYFPFTRKERSVSSPILPALWGETPSPAWWQQILMLWRI